MVDWLLTVATGQGAAATHARAALATLLADTDAAAAAAVLARPRALPTLITLCYNGGTLHRRQNSGSGDGEAAGARAERRGVGDGGGGGAHTTHTSRAQA